MPDLDNVGRTASHPPFDRVFVQFAFLGPVFWLLTQIPGGAGGVEPEAEAFLRCVPWLLAFAGIWMLPVVWLTIFGASRLDQLCRAIRYGRDENGDRRVLWNRGESGLKQAIEHMNLLKRGEGLTR